MNKLKLSKESVLTAAAVFLCITLSKSQTTAWHTNGDNVSGSSGILGTTNCADVRIQTNGKDRITYLCSGGLRTGGNTTGSDTNSVNDRMSFGPSSSAGRFEVNGFLNSTLSAIYAKVNNPASASVTAIRAVALAASGLGYGIQSEGGSRAIYALNNPGSYSGKTYGLYSSSQGTAGNRHGIYTTASGTGTGTHYGLYATASGGSTSYAGYFSGSSATYAGYFSGNVTVTGTFSNPSDRKLKDNITPEKNALNNLMKLQPEQYYFKKEFVERLNVPSSKQHGLIADDVEKVFPELVTDNIQAAQYDNETENVIADEIHFKGINYTGFVPVLIESIKEQQQQIEKLKSDNDELRSEITEMKMQMNNIIASTSVRGGTESLKSTVIIPSGKASLEQNNPNPFSSTTEIHYFIPSAVAGAVINILSSDQKLVKTFPLNEKGAGALIIPAASLPAGEYIYELVVNGIKADRKTMIIAK